MWAGPPTRVEDPTHSTRGTCHGASAEGLQGSEAQPLPAHISVAGSQRPALLASGVCLLIMDLFVGSAHDGRTLSCCLARAGG